MKKALLAAGPFRTGFVIFLTRSQYLFNEKYVLY
jgi:hypothetical protein